MEPLARISNYNDLVAALRARKEALGLSDASLDTVAGLAPGHTCKVLGPTRARGIGAATLEAYLMALAVDFVMVENPDKRATVTAHRDWPNTPRKAGQARTGQPVGRHAIRRVMREMGLRSYRLLTDRRWAALSKKGGKASGRKLSPAERSEKARRAALAKAAARRQRLRAADSSPPAD
jgi:hypothetical protein